MEPKETTQQKLTRVAKELGSAMRKQAGGRWGAVRTARRNLGTRHVWRFRTDGGDPDRFLLISHRSMTEGRNPTATLLAQLQEARWLDRMHAGPETSFMLAPNGRLRARSVE
jgi:hypothetical protein